MKNKLPWMALKNVNGVGNHLFKKLIECFHTPDSVFNASIQELMGVEGISAALAREIKHNKGENKAKKDLEIACQKGIHIITMADRSYPPLLHHIPDPPPVLYVSGTLEPATDNIAVVGSRNATQYGIAVAKQLCRDLAHRKLNVVSGMAKGIDTAAHLGALAGDGKTFAILGTGIDVIYPSENKKLFHEIAEMGAVISEFPFGTGPEPFRFPLRNRIICGMSLGTVVVEAGMKSGSLITARLAAEQGREVFAVPGSVRSFKSTGTHNLLKQGAKLVEHANDIIEELLPLLQDRSSGKTENQDAPKKNHPTLDSDETIVFKALEPYPVHIDDILRSTGLNPGKLAGILLKLELEGVVNQSPGNFFSTCEE
ncbi:MAG: DNA-processing protein DprA [Desulfobacterales bacterium]